MRVSWGQPRLPSQERSSGLPNFWGSVFMPTPFNAEGPNSARMGRGLVFRGQPSSGVAAHLTFWCSPTYMTTLFKE